MVENPEVGNRVRFADARIPPIKTFVIVECPVAGSQALTPSTVVVRMAEEAKPERDFYRVGNHRLELAPQGGATLTAS